MLDPVPPPPRFFLRLGVYTLPLQSVARPPVRRPPAPARLLSLPPGAAVRRVSPFPLPASRPPGAAAPVAASRPPCAAVPVARQPPAGCRRSRRPARLLCFRQVPGRLLPVAPPGSSASARCPGSSRSSPLASWIVQPLPPVRSPPDRLGCRLRSAAPLSSFGSLQKKKKCLLPRALSLSLAVR